ncbi:hypothetical protein EC844_11135 [Acinetobacter calcoaceticus]|uniref:Uncharacterized protein n=1 Tax=Acinetobacter calcoaceticus TaxID=471 RepID=A0A4R1XWR6_ACICA|nr:hypothetical protein EC844_11135 [Acinetobacter calcoaceticus]
MLLNRLLQLPNPAGNLDVLKQFSAHLMRYDISFADAPRLVQIATDQQLYYGNDREFFAMHYALYALGGLQYAEACPMILAQLNQINVHEDEWIDSYVCVFELMGEKAIPYLIQACSTVSLDNVFILTESLGKLVTQHPAYREKVLLAFDYLLARIELSPAPSHGLFSGEISLLMGWLDMKAIERIDVIRKLNRRHKFDQRYVGIIKDIEQELGIALRKPKKVKSFYSVKQ